MRKGLGRIIVVVSAFLAATLAALGIGVGLGLERFTHATHASDDAWWTLATLIWHGFQLSFLMTLFIAIMVVVAGEVARIRSALFYIAGGGLAVAATPLLIGLNDRGNATPPAVIWPAVIWPAVIWPAVIWQVFATAGFVGGAIYWAIAGRRA
jgi:hypothetical protein